jgi:hypothetical protein
MALWPHGDLRIIGFIADFKMGGVNEQVPDESLWHFGFSTPVCRLVCRYFICIKGSTIGISC